MRVQVFYFKVYDHNRDEMVVPGKSGMRSKRTLDDIQNIRGVPDMNSGELIENSQLDEFGRYYPAKG